MNLRRFISRLKYKYTCYKQRKEYGCDNEDIYSLDYSFYKWAVPRIKLYKDQMCGLPGAFVFDVEQEFLLSGKYKYDRSKCRFESKQVRDKIWKKAKSRWVSILDEILLGFEDALQEENDFDAWVKKYKGKVTAANKELEKCKTKEQKTEVWKKHCPNYIAQCRGCGLAFHADCFAFEVRKKSKELFAEYISHMWL